MDTSLTVAPSGPPPAPAEPTSRKPGVTGKVRRAVDAMVWLGLHRDKAAEHAGLAVHSLYQALRRPPVKAYYLDQCETLRTSGRARRLHRLEALAAQDDNLNAAVAAIKAAEQMGEQDVSRTNGGAAQTPGFLITIVNTAALGPSHALPNTRQPATIEAQPIDNTAERE